MAHRYRTHEPLDRSIQHTLGRTMEWAVSLHDQYVKLGVQYYVAGRHSLFCGHIPVAGNLFHHSFEMMLCSFLVRNGFTQDMLKRMNHDLRKVWHAVRDHHDDPKLARWDGRIAKLHNWEEIRFPTGDFRAASLGIAGTVGAHDWPADGPALRRKPNEVRYQLRLWELDELFKVTVHALGIDRDMVRDAMGIWDVGVETYERDNHYPI